MEMKLLNQLCNEIRTFETIKFTKSLELASVNRTNGNKSFAKGNFDIALQSYNQAILLAPYDSQEIYFSFANRSAALFHLNRFTECLDDIQSAFDYGYPIEKADKVLKRKLMCQDKLSSLSPSPLTSSSQQQETNDYAKKSETKSNLTNQENLNQPQSNRKLKSKSKKNAKNQSNAKNEPKMLNKEVNKSLASEVQNQQEFSSEASYLSNSVEITKIQNKGNGIRAIENITSGSTILEESSAIGILSPDHYSAYCYHCLKAINNHPYPCQGCSQICFCSSKCSSVSWARYHSRECRYLDYFIFSQNFHYVPKIALRILLLCSLETCMKYHREQMRQSSTVSTESPPKSTKIASQTDLYSSIYSLIEHPEDSNDYTYFTFKIIAYLIEVLKEKFSLDQVKILSSLLTKHFRSTIVNAIAIQDRSIKPSSLNSSIPEISEFEIGCGLYLNFRYLNHSCIPNAHLAWFSGNFLRISALRDIKAGEEILNSYGVHYKVQLVSHRQKMLQSSYYFKCTCEACLTELQPVNKAFLCPECSSPVIADGSLVCIECGKKDHLDLETIISETQAIHKLIEYDETHRSTDDLTRFEVTEKILSEAHTILSKFLYKTHSELAKIYRKLISCYIKLGQFKKSYEFSRKYLEAVKSSSDTFDLSVLNALLIVYFCYFNHSKEKISPSSASGSSNPTNNPDLSKINDQIKKLTLHLIPESSSIQKILLDYVVTLKY